MRSPVDNTEQEESGYHDDTGSDELSPTVTVSANNHRCGKIDMKPSLWLDQKIAVTASRPRGTCVRGMNTMWARWRALLLSDQIDYSDEA